MTEFVIKLADERGRVMEQSHAAATAEELRARFTQAGYYVYSVKAKSMLGASKKKVKLETFLIFNQQFLTLIKAGLPILGSLELLAKRQKLAHFRAQLEDVAARVKTGESISQAFEAQGGFPIVYTTTLLAGERSGNLEEVLQRFLDFQRVSLTFRKKLKAMSTITNVNAANTKNGIRQASPPIPNAVPQLIVIGVRMIPSVRPIDSPVITMPSCSSLYA